MISPKTNLSSTFHSAPFPPLSSPSFTLPSISLWSLAVDISLRLPKLVFRLLGLDDDEAGSSAFVVAAVVVDDASPSFCVSFVCGLMSLMRSSFLLVVLDFVSLIPPLPPLPLASSSPSSSSVSRVDRVCLVVEPIVATLDDEVLLIRVALPARGRLESVSVL